MQTITIPEHAHPAIVTLLKLSDEQFETFSKALSVARPGVFALWIAKPIAEELDVDLRQLESLVDTLFTLNGLLPVWAVSADVFGPAVAAGAVEQHLGGLTELGPDSEKLGLRLASLIAVPTIEVSAKARDLWRANRETLMTARVITDLRPVFSDADGLKPAAGIITHSFVMRVMTSGGISEQSGSEAVHQISLDLDDLRQLKDQIQRALTKESSLREWMKDAGLRCIKTSYDKD